MPENLPAPTGPGWFAEWVSSGKLPGAAKALAQLVGDAAGAVSSVIGIGKAKADQVQQGIKDDTAARSAMTSAFVKVAAEKGIQDPSLVDRSVDLWIGERLRKQTNRESVAFKSIEHLDDTSEAISPDAAPTDDWMNIFGAYAENANSEKLRDTWARVLAGEIRKPGSFSFRTLQLISVLDQNLAELIEEVSTKVFGENFVYLSSEDRKGEKLERLQTLEDVSFLRVGILSVNLDLKAGVPHYLLFSDHVVGVTSTEDQNLVLNVAILSPVGREIVSMIKSKSEIASVLELARGIKENQNVAVFWADTKRDGNVARWEYTNAV